MALSYSLVILQGGREPVIERRDFIDLGWRELTRLGVTLAPDGSIPDYSALLLVNLWNSKSAREAQDTHNGVRFMYYL